MTFSVNEFLCDPLTTWFNSCLEDSTSSTKYHDIVDGVLLHNVFLQIHPEPLHNNIVYSGGDSTVRVDNLNMVLANIKHFYEERLGHLVLEIPDVEKLGTYPETNVQEAKLLLLLLLGCAIQCANKEKFIKNIQMLTNGTQLAIVDYIQQVTERQVLVLTREYIESDSTGNTFHLMKSLLQERNMYRKKWEKMEPLNVNSRKNSGCDDVEKVNLSSSVDTRISCSDDEASWKDKMRKQRQELNEKAAALCELQEELDHTKSKLEKLKTENRALCIEAKAAKTYKDELDVAIESVERADRLEAEVSRYREKLTDLSFYKSRVDELQEDNRILLQTRDMLEGQIADVKKRTKKMTTLEAENLKYKEIVNNLISEREVDREKYQYLCEENSQLQRVAKEVMNSFSCSESTSDSEEPCANNSLSEQLNTSAQTRALKLELENHRLITILESLDEKPEVDATKVAEVDKEKENLSLQLKSVKDTVQRLTQQNADLEGICNQALSENKKLQGALKIQREAFETQEQRFDSQCSKLKEMENSRDSVLKEKHSLQLLLQSAQERADNSSQSLDDTTKKLESLRSIENELEKTKAHSLELESSIILLELEKQSIKNEMAKSHQIIEEKNAALDKAECTTKTLERRMKEMEIELKNSGLQILKIQDNKESGTISNKVNTQQLLAALEKLGLDVNMIMTLSPENVLEKISNISEVANYVKKQAFWNSNATLISDGPDSTTKDTKTNNVNLMKKQIQNLQSKLSTVEEASKKQFNENSKLQIYVGSLESQNASLTSLHTTLQLSNAQLVSEKEDYLKERITQNRKYSELSNDFETLKNQNRQLTTDYENLRNERDTLLTNLNEGKHDLQNLRETLEKLAVSGKKPESECEPDLAESKTNSHLRSELSRLQDDFKKLYDTAEKYKLTIAKLNSKVTELKKENCMKTERCEYLESKVKFARQRCHLLSKSNSELDLDRRSLMDQISQLFTEYRELLNSWLEDRKSYHMEEKMYTEKLNALRQQRDLLEEKIIQQFKKLEGSTKKKRGLGSNLVRRFGKAVRDSDLFSMHRGRRLQKGAKKMDEKVSESPESTASTESSAITDDSSDKVNGTSENSTITTIADGILLSSTPGTRDTVYYNSGPHDMSMPVSSIHLEESSKQSETQDLISFKSANQSTHSEHLSLHNNTDASNPLIDLSTLLDQNTPCLKRSVSALNESPNQDGSTPRKFTSNTIPRRLIPNNNSTDASLKANALQRIKALTKRYNETLPDSPTEWCDYGCV